MDDCLDPLAGAFHQVQQRKQDLSIGLAELLDDGRRFLSGLRYDLVWFTRGGWLLSDLAFGKNRILSKPAAVHYQPSTSFGTPSLKHPLTRSIPVSALSLQ